MRSAFEIINQMQLNKAVRILKINKDLLDGNYLGFHESWTFPDNYRFLCEPNQAIISINHPVDGILGLACIEVSGDVFSINWVQGIGRNEPKHPNWSELLVKELVLAGTTMLEGNPNARIVCDYIRKHFKSLKHAYIALKKKLIDLENNWVPQLSKLSKDSQEVFEYHKRQILEQINVVESKLRIYGKIRDRFFDNVGNLNYSKRRVKEIMETKNQVKAFRRENSGIRSALRRLIRPR